MILKKENKYHTLLCERINKLLINEKLGVADELDALILQTGNDILKRIQKEPIQTDGNIQYKKYTHYIDFCGKKNFPIRTTLLIYDEAEDALNAMENGLTGAYITTMNGIDIFAFAVDNEVFRSDFFDTLGHEMEHAYQDIKSGISGKEQMKRMFKDTAYSVAKKYIEDKSNLYKFHLARCVYASEPKEQDALINGMFQYYRANTFNEKAFDSINKSPATIWLENFYESFLFVKRNRNNDEMIEAFSEFKTYFNDFQTFLRRMRNAIKRYENKYSRTVYYCKMRLLRFYHPTKPIQLENYLKL